MCLSTLNHRALRAKFHTIGGSQNQILMLHDPACKNFADMNFSLRAQFSLDCNLLFFRLVHAQFLSIYSFWRGGFISPFCCWQNWQNFISLTRCARRFVLQYLLNFKGRIFDKKGVDPICAIFLSWNLTINNSSGNKLLFNSRRIMFLKTCISTRIKRSINILIWP